MSATKRDFDATERDDDSDQGGTRRWFDHLSEKDTVAIECQLMQRVGSESHHQQRSDVASVVQEPDVEK